MGIYISNMEMPKECRDCPLEKNYSSGGFTRCSANGKLLSYDSKPIPFDGKPDWCPIVGFNEYDYEIIEKTYPIEFTFKEYSMITQYMLLVDAIDVNTAIMNAISVATDNVDIPTIIPSDKGVRDG